MVMFDYKLVEAVAKVVDEGGFDKAAKALCLTQSAVSQRVRLLEEQTGQILIARTTPPRPTQAGKQILKHYRQVKCLEQDLSGSLLPLTYNGYTSLSIGVNADSLSTWFLDALHPFLLEQKVLIDLRVDDQEQTQQLLKDGEVVGCVSSQEVSVQGCNVRFLGCMNYIIISSPVFKETWFDNGITLDSTACAPALLFNAKDELHGKFLAKLFGVIPNPIPAHYIPSTEKMIDHILRGHAYGVLPEQHCFSLIREGKLMNLIPDTKLSVKLYWHYWNINSSLLKRFTEILVKNSSCLVQ